MNNEITMFTDGACSGNPGIGAWSCIVYDDDCRIIYDAIVGKDEPDWQETTNNRMEIKGLLQALELATTKYKNDKCIIYCDSAYCVNMFNSWLRTWASNNWIGSNKQQVKNLDLVKQLYKFATIEFPNFQVIKTKGHDNILGNELADAYAVAHKCGDASKLAKILKENDITLMIG